ncbi:MAG: beta strand repeat-containing protein, partial [Caulobacteraceae bacterium]
MNYASTLTNGSSSDHEALIQGDTGARLLGASTVTNFGVILGQGGVAVILDSAADTLVCEAGSSLMGAVNAGAGTIDVVSGAPMITGGVISSGAITGAGTLALAGGTSVFSAGASLAVARVAVSGATTAVNVEGDLQYAGVWAQSAGILSVAAGAHLDFTGAGDSFAGLVSVGDGASLGLTGAVDNAGLIALDGAGALTALVIGAGGVGLTGGGTVRLGLSGHDAIEGATAAAVLTNVDNTISGSGFLGRDGLGLINGAAGTIEAGDAHGLVLDTGADIVANAGLIEATGTGGLTIRSTSIDGSAGGTILASNGSHVALQGGVLIGGTLETAGSGTIRTAAGGGNGLDGTGSAIHNQGKFTVSNASALTLQGLLDNTGRLQLTASSAAATLTVGAAGAILSGGGHVLLSDSARNTIAGVSSATRLTNLDNVIAGAGRIGAGSLVLINQAGGEIIASQSAALIIDTGAATVVNAGVILARGAGGLTIQGAVANDGVLVTKAGVFTVMGAVSGTGHATLYGGTLDFTSDFSQRVIFAGASGVLELARSQSFTGAVFGFSHTGGTAFDLLDIAFGGSTQATFAGNANAGVLTITDGTHTARIDLRGDYLGDVFTATSDGHGGTRVVD